MLLAELAEELDHELTRAITALGISRAREQDLERALVVARLERGRDLVVVERLHDRRLRRAPDHLALPGLFGHVHIIKRTSSRTTYRDKPSTAKSAQLCEITTPY